MPKAKSILAWHFLSDAGLMRDGREPRKVETYDGKLSLCKAGLHASKDILDALLYAPGAVLCRVRCSDEIVQDNDKLVCTRREILWRVDAKDTLREFARLCALRAARVHAARSCEAVGLRDHVALRALPDDATPPQIEALASSAAEDAIAQDAVTQDATEDAARATKRALWAAVEAAWAAGGAARTAARADSWAAARIAVKAAAWTATGAGVAWDAVWAAERKHQAALLLRMIRKLPKSSLR